MCPIISLFFSYVFSLRKKNLEDRLFVPFTHPKLYFYRSYNVRKDDDFTIMVYLRLIRGRKFVAGIFVTINSGQFNFSVLTRRKARLTDMKKNVYASLSFAI